jgi:hypothetical protein
MKYFFYSFCFGFLVFLGMFKAVELIRLAIN